MRELDAGGLLTPARMGKARTERSDLRGDRSVWLSDLHLPPSLQALWDGFEQLRDALNAEAWLGLRRFGLQLACYPGEGSFYAPHRDAFRGDPTRRVTAIYYLNPGWEAAHGGVLSCETPDGEHRIEPRLDRLVVFLSDAVTHTVKPAYAARFAVTAWYRGAERLP